MTKKTLNQIPPSLEDRLKYSLEVHGIPSGIETHQELLWNGWKSAAESAFIDPDTEKTRRFDLVTWKAQDVGSEFSRIFEMIRSGI